MHYWVGMALALVVRGDIYMIGEFGAGLYSAYFVEETVTVVSQALFRECCLPASYLLAICCWRSSKTTLKMSCRGNGSGELGVGGAKRDRMVLRDYNQGITETAVRHISWREGKAYLRSHSCRDQKRAEGFHCKYR